MFKNTLCSDKLGITLGALLTLIFTLYPSPALAQPPETPGQIISPGMAPFTETWAEMQKRDAAHQAAIEAGIQPPPPRVRLGSPRPPIHKRTAPGALAPLAPAVEQPSLPSGPRPFGTGAPGPSAPQAIGTNFAGVNMTESGFIPPDTMGAVGPGHFVEIINGAVAIYQKDGTRLSLVDLDIFFTFVYDSITYPRGYAFDTRVLFDKESDRWFAIALELNGQINNHILLAVSQTSDPTGTWDKYVIPVGEAGNFTDFDTLGVDSNGVYFGMTIFPNAGPNFAKIAATGKASLLFDLVNNPSPSLGAVKEWSNITDMWSSPQPAHNHDSVGAAAAAWFVSSSATYTHDVNYRTLTWSGGTPSLTTASNVTTPSYGSPMDAPANGSTTNIDVGDDRLVMAVIRNNRLWTSRHVGVNSSGGVTGSDRTAAEWLELNVSTTTASLVQSGRVFDDGSISGDAADPLFFYYPSIMVNANGDAALGFSGSNNANFIGAYTCGRLAADPPGTTGTPTLIKPGEASYQRTDNLGRNRWGDYSYTSLDPTDNLTFWTIQEYATSIGANRWGTWVAQLTLNEAVSTPTIPTGPTFGKVGQTLTYTTGGAIDNLGNPVEYSFDWGDGTPPAWGLATQSHSWASASNFLVKGWARSATDHAVLSAFSPALTVNIGGPTISGLTINAGRPITTSSTVTLTYATTGAPTQIRTSTGTTWSSWMTPVPASLSLNLGFTNGQREVYVQVKDAQGRVSDVARANIILDTANPTGVVKLNGGAYSVLFNPAGTTVRLQSAMFDANMSGALVRIKQDVTFSGDPDPAAPWETFNFTGRDFNYTTTGSKKIYVQFKDGAGRNSSVYSASINISTTGTAWPGPSAVTVTALQLNGGAPYATATAATLTYNVSNTNVRARYLTGTFWSAWETPSFAGSTATKTLTLSGTNGPRLVYVQLRENGTLKLTDPQSAGIILDTAAPNGAIQINNGDMSVTPTGATTNVTLTIVASDTASGIDQIYYDQTGVAPGAFVPFTPTVNNFPLDTAATGTKYVYIWFKDKAGKVSTRKQDYINVVP